MEGTTDTVTFKTYRIPAKDIRKGMFLLLSRDYPFPRVVKSVYKHNGLTLVGCKDTEREWRECLYDDDLITIMAVKRRGFDDTVSEW